MSSPSLTVQSSDQSQSVDEAPIRGNNALSTEESPWSSLREIMTEPNTASQVTSDPGPSTSGLQKKKVGPMHNITPKKVERAPKRKMPVGGNALDSMASSMETTLKSVNNFFQNQNSMSLVGANKAYSVAVEQMVNAIRNSKRRRKVQCQIMTLLAATASDSEDSE